MVVDNETGEIVEANDAHSRHKRIIDLRFQAERTFLDLGKELYHFSEEKQYLELGYDSFEVYLASPEVEIDRRAAFMLKGVYKTFIMELKVQPLHLLPAGYSKLDMIRSRVTPDNVEGLLHDARELSRSDLQEKMGINKTNKASITTVTPPALPYNAPAEDDMPNTENEVTRAALAGIAAEDFEYPVYDVIGEVSELKGKARGLVEEFIRDNIAELREGDRFQMYLVIRPLDEGK